MNESYQKVQNFVLELGFAIDRENPEDGILVVSKEGSGIQNMVIGVADPILIFEQFIFSTQKASESMFQQLLQKNRDIIHGAFVLDESGSKVIFRDTLQIENLDLNEVDGTFNSLSLLLTEYADDLIKFSKN